MNERKFNKKLLLIFSAVLAAVGAAVGVVSVWQVFGRHPELVNGIGLKVVFYLACGVVPAALMWLTAKPLLSLIYAMCDRIKSKFSGVKGAEVASVMLGVIIGAFFGFVAELITELFLYIFALRVVIAAVLSVAVAYFVTLLCLKLIGKNEEHGEREDAAESMSGENGYLLSLSALKNEKTVLLCENWLMGEVFVSERTAEKFGEAAPESEKIRIEKLIGDGRIKTVSGADRSDAELAGEMNLKVIVESRESADFSAASTPLLALDEL